MEAQLSVVHDSWASLALRRHWPTSAGRQRAQREGAWIRQTHGDNDLKQQNKRLPSEDIASPGVGPLASKLKDGSCHLWRDVGFSRGSIMDSTRTPLQGSCQEF